MTQESERRQGVASGNPSTGLPLAEQIESAYSAIKINRAHYYILAMLLLGVFFDSLEQNSVGITGPVLREFSHVARQVGQDDDP